MSQRALLVKPLARGRVCQNIRRALRRGFQAPGRACASRNKQPQELESCKLLASEGCNVLVVVVWCCGVCPCVCVIVVSSIERGCSDPTAGGSVCEASEKPFCSCSCVWKDCPCHGCCSSEEGYLDFEFPSVLGGVG